MAIKKVPLTIQVGLVLKYKLSVLYRNRDINSRDKKVYIFILTFTKFFVIA